LNFSFFFPSFFFFLEMAGWGEEDVGRWLHENGFDEHVEMFKGVCIISSSVLLSNHFSREQLGAQKNRGETAIFFVV